MQSTLEEKILANPKYRQLVSKQSKLRWSFAIAILLAYFIFVITAFTYPEYLTAKISTDSIVPVGIPLSICIFIVQIILTIGYAKLEKNQFAQARKEIIQEAKS